MQHYADRNINHFFAFRACQLEDEYLGAKLQADSTALRMT